ncbi:MAG: glycosyltransferase [Bacteroidales bacterium]|nr:glycosyltransferase [Bacteroidales bacterium]
MKLLSFIIPLYNSAQWLPKCLDSVLDQDIDDDQLEIICVNDGSPDNSADIVRRYQAEHPQSVVLLEQENQGPSGARNNGMRHASGKYLCFVDPDDFVEPHVYGRLLAMMEEKNLDMLRFNYQIVDENYSPLEKRVFEKQFNYNACLISGTDFLADRLDIACHIWKYVYRTEIITQNHIWCFTGDYYDDTPWLPMVIMKAERFAVCDIVAYNYQERSDSLVKTKTLQAVRRQSEGSFLLLKLLKEEMRVLKGGETECINMQALQSVQMPADKLKKIISWYEMIIAHVTVSLLTDVALFDYDSRRTVLQRLKELGVNKLSKEKALPINKRKIIFFNVSPLLMVLIIHAKSLV